MFEDQTATDTNERQREAAIAAFNKQHDANLREAALKMAMQVAERGAAKTVEELLADASRVFNWLRNDLN